MNESELEEAHKHSINNKSEIEKSNTCGCFYCKEIFAQSEIKNWINDSKEPTAKCPYCQIDSVIGDASGIKIDSLFLQEMHDTFFSENGCKHKNINIKKDKIDQCKTNEIDNLLKAVKQGDNYSKLLLSILYIKGNGVEQDYKKGFELALESAESGNFWAMSWLGDFYYYGWGVEKDLEKARYWYKKEYETKEMLIKTKNSRQVTNDLLEGFINVGKIKDWKNWITNLPKEKGVYAITRDNGNDPCFLEIGTGGFFKDENPNVSIKELLDKWNKSNHTIMYIGRTGYDLKDSDATLYRRVKDYMRFGSGEKAPHRGGKFIWQLADSKDFDVWYKVSDKPETLESELIENLNPFANLKR